MAVQLGSLERLAQFTARGLGGAAKLLSSIEVRPTFSELGSDFPPELVLQGGFLSALDSVVANASDVSALADELDTIATDQGRVEVLAASAILIGKIADTIQSFQVLANALSALAGVLPDIPASEVTAFASTLPKRLLDDLLIRRLETEHPTLASGAALLGIIDRSLVPRDVPSDSENPAPVRAQRVFHLDGLGRLASAPSAYLANRIGWSQGSFDALTVLTRFHDFISLLGYTSEISGTATEPVLKASALTITAMSDGLTLGFKFPVPEDLELTIPLRAGLVVRTTTTGSFEKGFQINLSPPARVAFAGPAGFQAELRSAFERTPVSPETRVVLFGQSGGTRLEADALELALGLTLQADAGVAVGEPEVVLSVVGGHAVVDFSSGDGLVAQLTGGGAVQSDFSLGATWSPSTGLRFAGSGGLALAFPLNANLGPISIRTLHLGINTPESGELPVELSVSVNAVLGPVTLTLERIGVEAFFSFPANGGNLGPAQLTIGFKPPNGVGVAVDAGVVRGGGFLYIEQSRYSGAIELSVFSIAVKAFGLIDTKLPDGSDGFSFVIVISAEFTPIQLGFGFTLNGVGGMVGVNRSVNAEALGDAARTGSLAHLLFPRNPVQDAPAIIHDLATVFPAAKGHYIFAPMAKLGWGTPTLITADIGVLLEFPGPRLGLVGVVRAQLPRADLALLNLQLAIAGLLDFPAKTLSIDAGLFDSRVVGYTVTGGMAYRLGFGNRPSFLMAIGGFNPAFDAPPAFPELARAGVEVGINGNPSLTVSGYFALTSNTAQVGAEMRLVAKKFGIRAEGWVGFDALFVFSPFSFRIDIRAGISVKFHGVGKSVTLKGTLTGPSPYHFTGKACVSVAFWDACLPVNIRFGNDRPAALPEINPWLGEDNADPRLNVRGLRAAVLDPRSWSGSNPPAGFGVVSLSEAATLERTPIDPLGAATLRQTVAPLGVKLERFGEYKPIGPDEFILTTVVMNGIPIPEGDIEVVTEAFPPAHFMELDKAERLSMESYVEEDAGFSIAPDRVSAGMVGSRVLEYETAYINAEGQRFGNQPLYVLSRDLLRGLLRSSASALGGVRRIGAQKYLQPNTPKRVSFGPKRYVVVDACSSVRNSSVTPTEVSQTRATLALRSHVAANPGDAGRFAVVPLYAEAS